MHNRSVPVDAIVPHVHYQDVPAAIVWLTRAFCFTEHFRYGDPVSGAQLHLGKAYIMLRSTPGQPTPAQLGYGTQSLTVFVSDIDVHWIHAKAAGARIVEEPHNTIYGERQYAAHDPEGHLWIFSQHVQDLSPTDWGAVLAK